jgi:gliding motility-associated-like protein
MPGLLATGLQAQTMEVTDANTPPFTPENLITNIFLGEGVEVISVMYDGDPGAVGFFKNGNNAVGIDRGIILTSGRAASSDPNCNGQLGANCDGFQFASNDAISSASDADLQSIATGGLNDVARYTIVFKPTADTLRFKYVFASEEYPEWACSSFNDVFGFFISGPGITGPFQNNGKNIALIPGTNTPVSINNVHPQNGGCAPVNLQFYNDNNGSAIQPVYDGYLDVFIAEAVVIPCETYTIKLSVADVGDSAYDTGVFLEAKSFGTGSLDVKTQTVSLDGTVTEGCASGTITFTLPNQAESDFLLDYNIIGSAENGVDFDFIPGNLFIPQGDSSLTIDIIGIVDQLEEGLETIGFDIQRDICNRDTFWIFIRDNEILAPVLGADTLLCLGDSLQLDGTLPILLPDPPTFTNENEYAVSHLAPTYSPLQVAGVQPLFLEPGVIKSVCVNIQHKWVDDLDLFLISPGGQFIELSSDNGSNCDNYNNVCFSPTANQSITFGEPWTPCGANIQAPFSNGAFQPEGVWSDLWDGSFPTNGTWQLLVLDDQAGFIGTILDWSITFEPLYQIYYRWEPATGLSCSDCPNPKASPDTTTTYVLFASDTYGCEVSDTITVEVTDKLDAPVLSCSDISNNSITFSWEDVPGASGYQVSVNGGEFEPANNGSTGHIVSGLLLNQSVSIEVFAVGTCNSDIGSTSCSTPDCVAPALALDQVNDVSCSGLSDGSIALTASGGAGNYQYLLGGQQFNATGIFTGLSAGVYDLTVIDALGCPNSLQAVISVANPLLLEAVIVQEVSCDGALDGSISVNVEGGTQPYNFIWQGVASDSILSGIGSGSYTVLVTDGNGCNDTLQVNLDDPAPMSLSLVTSDVSCFQGSDGSVAVAASGGTAPFDFEWSSNAGNSANPLVENLAAGDYSVLVTDANGCQQSATATLGEPPLLSASIAASNPTCSYNTDGTANVNVSGGTPGYSISWSNGDSGPLADQLAGDTYFVTVSDQKNCLAFDTVSLVAPPVIQLTAQGEDISCFNLLDGSIFTQVSQAVEPLSYSWDNGSSLASPSGLAAGNYCLTLTDAAACTATVCQQLNQPDALQLDVLVTNAGCSNGAGGAVDLNVNGGTIGYTYTWSNSAVSQDISNLTAGTYVVLVTDANSCTAQASATVTEAEPLEIQASHTDVSCKNGDDGSISIAVTGGSGGFQFSWTGPGSFNSDQEDLANLGAGIYNLALTDALGCSSAISVEVIQPATAVSVSVATPQEICNNAANGSATATATGGTGSYFYVWSNGQQAATASNLPAGTYSVIVQDGNGCRDTAQTEIIEQGELSFQLVQADAKCHNSSDGSATIASITQGAASLPVSAVGIAWSNGSSNTASIGGLSGGQSYQVTITNSLGCTATAGITIGNPPLLSAQVVSTQDVSCKGFFNGSATVTASGGSLPYAFSWDANAGSQSGATAQNLPAGSFSVIATDVNGCTASATALIGEPSQVELVLEQSPVSCSGGNDGTASVSVSGGFPPYQLTWENGSSDNELSDLEAGWYLLSVTDGKGCILIDSVEVQEPNSLEVALQVNGVSCYGQQNGSIEIIASGGIPPYLFSQNGQDFFGSNVFIALQSDYYDLFIRDLKGCETIINDVYVAEPDSLAVNLGPDTQLIYGAVIHIFPELINFDTSGVLTYNWFSLNPQTQPAYTWTPFGEFEVKSPTTAVVTVEDENGCSATDTVNLFVIDIRGIAVPTGFAPGSGGDPANDLLHVHGISHMVEKIRLFRVFDAWGELMYEARDFSINDLSVGWDGNFKGQPMPSGVYAWYLEVDYTDGVSETHKGNTTLIR